MPKDHNEQIVQAIDNYNALVLRYVLGDDEGPMRQMDVVFLSGIGRSTIQRWEANPPESPRTKNQERWAKFVKKNKRRIRDRLDKMPPNQKRSLALLARNMRRVPA